MAGSKTSASLCDRAPVKQRPTLRRRQVNHILCPRTLRLVESYLPLVCTGLTHSQAPWATRHLPIRSQDQGPAARPIIHRVAPILHPRRRRTRVRGAARRRVTCVAFKVDPTRPLAADLERGLFSHLGPSANSTCSSWSDIRDCGPFTLPPIRRPPPAPLRCHFVIRVFAYVTYLCRGLLPETSRTRRTSTLPCISTIAAIHHPSHPLLALCHYALIASRIGSSYPVNRILRAPCQRTQSHLITLHCIPPPTRLRYPLRHCYVPYGFLPAPFTTDL